MQKDVNMAEKVTVDFENKQEWGFPMLGLLYSIAGEVIEDQDFKTNWTQHKSGGCL